MRMKITKRRKFLEDTKKYFREKQNTFLQFGILTYHKNRRIELHYRNNSYTERRINNI